MTSERGREGRERTLTPRELAIMDRIEARIKSAGISWATLALDVGKTKSSGSQWSGRRSFPREESLYRIAQRLGVEMGYLLTGDQPGEQTRAQTVNEKALLELTRELSPAEQQALLAVARSLKGSLTKK
jgi:transcriptional regulator with XRE-family HTH domain